MVTSVSAQELFTGHHWISEVVVSMENGIVQSISKEGYDPKNAMPLVVPALIDLQIYGAENKLLSVFCDVDTIEKIARYCYAGGAAYFQPTIATDTTEVIYKAIDAVKAYKTNGGKGCIGLHIEGPWINVEKKGAHKAEYIHSPSKQEVQELIAYGKDFISMITVAPEVCDNELIQIIQEAGIIVSAGHSNASYEVATTYLNNGITVATHLYNAMSSLQHRAPGLVGALFNHKTAMCSLVADGYHVDFAAIKIAKKMMGDRLFCITDAVATTTTGNYQHTLVGDKYESHGVLSGSALTQLKSVNNLVEEAGIDVGEAIKMCSLYPAKVMQKHEIKGTIEVGGKADLLCLSADRQLIKILVA
ncbi:MAG: N-acetylglucosamine-6-phosphate deacetylase [Bacteroidetes bacterium]|jgi:N-acetylglucosamine-6-phosphate deacetylase|nr:N-acetylglucosamine-6-phosphate deacetylase [Bacteroidota bacterium]